MRYETIKFYRGENNYTNQINEYMLKHNIIGKYEERSYMGRLHILVDKQIKKDIIKFISKVKHGK